MFQLVRAIAYLGDRGDGEDAHRQAEHGERSEEFSEYQRTKAAVTSAIKSIKVLTDVMSLRRSNNQYSPDPPKLGNTINESNAIRNVLALGG